MKRYLFTPLIILCAMPALFSSCIQTEEEAYAGREHFIFSAKGGTNEAVIFSTKNASPAKKTANWDFLMVLVSDTIISDAKEKQLEDGSYVVDADWVKFYYPRNKGRIRIEVQPNPDSTPRKARFNGGWKMYNVDLFITQDGKTN